MALTDKQRALRESFVDTFGYWDEAWEGLLVTDEEFFAAYVRFGGTPWRAGPCRPRRRSSSTSQWTRRRPTCSSRAYASTSATR